MSSYATAYLRDGRPVCSFRDGVDQLFFIIFTKDDWIEIRGEEAHRLTARYFPDQLPDEAVVTGFRASALALRDRLDVTGVGVEAVSSELVRLIGDQIDRKLDLSKRYSAELDG